VGPQRQHLADQPAHAGNNVVNGLLLEMLLGGDSGPGQVTVMLLTIAPLAVCAIAVIRSDGLRPAAAEDGRVRSPASGRTTAQPVR
jgi:hypothetical protein